MVRGKGLVSRKGFTLIEVLVVTVIVAVISLAIFSTLNSGLKVWHRVHAASADEDTAIFLLKFGTDVRSAFMYGNETLSGTADSIEIPSLDVMTQAGAQPGIVVFSYNSTGHLLCRSRKTRSQAEEHADGITVSCLRNVRKCAFSYYANETNSESRGWSEDWQKTGLPLAVRVEIERSVQGINQTSVKTAYIPVSAYRYEEQKEE